MPSDKEKEKVSFEKDDLTYSQSLLEMNYSKKEEKADEVKGDEVKAEENDKKKL